MSFSRNAVVLLPVPFTDLTSRKVRPAIVLGQNLNDVFVVPITSQMTNTDFALRDWQAAGLNVPCGVKAQLATIESTLVIKAVGTLTAFDQSALNNRVRAWLQL